MLAYVSFSCHGAGLHRRPTPQQLRIGWPSSSNQHDEAHTGSAAAAAVQHPTIGLGGGSGCGGGSNTAKRWGGEGGGGDDLGRPSRPAWQQLLAMLTAVLLPATLLLPAPAQAATAASKRSGFVSQQDERNFMSSWQLDAFVDRMWDLSGPILNNIGFSGLLGACTAAALKVCRPGCWLPAASTTPCAAQCCSWAAPASLWLCAVVWWVNMCAVLSRQLRSVSAVLQALMTVVPPLCRAALCCAVQWVGRTLAASVGIGLVLVQVLSYYNVITVNWSVVHKQARQVLDSTGDG